MGKDPNNRYVSFEHFHKSFLTDIQETEEGLNQLILHLFAYLASWGMLRGSTFSLQKDYLFHRPVAEVLLKWKSEMGYLIDLLAAIDFGAPMRVNFFCSSFLN